MLLWNWQLTRQVCDTTRFSGILIMDGKYVAVKGYDRKIPFLYGIDYLTHDIVHGDLFVVEDYMSFLSFFQKLSTLNYPLQIVVADDRAGLRQALNQVFPYARLQLCHNHFLHNIRVELKIKTVGTYKDFFYLLQQQVFINGRDEFSIEAGYRKAWIEGAKGSRFLQNILLGIYQRKTILFNYLKIPNSPNNTNLIELYNSHLNGRLKTIKGFQSFDSARGWLNAWMIRRRTKTLTDCEKKFKHLNKHASLEFTIKKQAHWPEQLTKLGIKRIKFFQKSG